MAIIKRVWWIEFKAPLFIGFTGPSGRGRGTLASLLGAAYTITDLPNVTC